MSCFAIMKAPRDEINHTPIVDGQFFVETDQYDSSDLSKYNKIYFDNGNNRIELGIKTWNKLTSRPFENINTAQFVVENGVLQMNDLSWSSIVNKPFKGVSTNRLLFIENGVLKCAYRWGKIHNVPFYTIGAGLNVDTNGNLNANVSSVEVLQVGNASNTTTSYQSLKINNVNNCLDDSMYMEDTQTLSTSNDTTFTFTNNAITPNSLIETYTSIWGIVPKNVDVSQNGVCTVTFAPYYTSTSLTCRIYIL